MISSTEAKMDDVIVELQDQLAKAEKIAEISEFLANGRKGFLDMAMDTLKLYIARSAKTSGD